MVLSIATACGRISENDFSTNSVIENHIKTITHISKPIKTETTATANISTNYDIDSEFEEFTEKHIVKAVSAEVYTTNELCYEDDNINMIMDNSKNLNQQLLCNICDKDDAK